MANFIQFRRPNRRSSTSSVYMQLLSSLATDLDNMLSELCTTPPPPYDRLSETRQTKYGIEGSGGSTQLNLSHRGTIVDNNRHSLTGTGGISQTLRGPAPSSYQGGLDYAHKPSGSGLSVGARHTEHFGTDVRAQGNANLWRNGNSRLDAVGSYGRHFGGPQGTGRANTYGGVQFQHRF